MRSLIFHGTRILPRDLINISWETFFSSRFFKNCITGKYEEILVNAFHFVKYRVILQQNQYFVCFAIFKTSSNCGLTALILIHALVRVHVWCSLYSYQNVFSDKISAVAWWLI
jgi:hypothetical protein